MKKTILLFAVLLTAIGAFAQIDSTTVTEVSNLGISALFGVIGNFIISHAVWFTLGAAVISEALGLIKKIPQNSIWQVLVWIIKAVLNAITKLLGNSKTA